MIRRVVKRRVTRETQRSIGPIEREKRPISEQLSPSYLRCAHDGSVRFMHNIERLRSGVCKSCARMHLAMPRASALGGGGGGPTHPRLSSR